MKRCIHHFRNRANVKILKTLIYVSHKQLVGNKNSILVINVKFYSDANLNSNSYSIVTMCYHWFSLCVTNINILFGRVPGITADLSDIICSLSFSIMELLVLHSLYSAISPRFLNSTQWVPFVLVPSSRSAESFEHSFCIPSAVKLIGEPFMHCFILIVMCHSLD